MGFSFSKYFLESVGHLFYEKEKEPKPNISSKKTAIQPRLVQNLVPSASFLEPLNFLVHALHTHSQLPSNYGLSLLLLYIKCFRNKGLYSLVDHYFPLHATTHLLKRQGK
jgi:hypothetical protein